MELGIVESFFDVECQRQILVILLSNGFVVDLHVVVDGFLITEVIVVLHFTVLK